VSLLDLKKKKDLKILESHKIWESRDAWCPSWRKLKKKKNSKERKI